MNNIDPHKISALLKQASQEFILPRYQSLKGDEIATKTGPRDLVTAADIEAEKFLTRVLPDLLPGSIVVGEEGVSNGTASLASLKTHSGPIWVVDPVDGTFNFANGTEHFGIMVALVNKQ